MIVLAYLLQRSMEWRNAHINLKMLTRSDKATEGAMENLRRIIGQMRIDVNLEVVTNQDQDFFEVLQDSSRRADLVFPWYGRARQGPGFPVVLPQPAAENSRSTHYGICTCRPGNGF
jgi:hypothetical protein